MEYNDFETTPLFSAINMAIQCNSDITIDDFCRTANGDPVCFLNARPQESTICKDTDIFLYACLNAKSLFTALIPNISYTIVRTHYLGGAVNYSNVQALPSDEDQVICIPAGTANPQYTSTPPPYDKYTIQVMARLDFGPLGVVNFEMTKEQCFIVSKQCCCDVEILFQSDPGGYDTICFEKVKYIDLQVTQTEICKSTPCGGCAKRGQTNTEAYEKYTLECKCVRSDQAIEMFRQFKKSESRLINIDGKLVDFLVDSDSVRIYEGKGGVTLTATGRVGGNLKTISA